MPNLEMARRISATKYNGAKTIGQIHKENSDFAMEYTWDSDIQSKTCYIYDYAHDDSPTICEGMTYENTTKTMIDAKFIITSYGSIDKDQVAYHLMFKPSQKIRFEDGDELYYYETEYKSKRDMVFPIGLYCDLPDDKGVYHRWIIMDYEESNQFMKYFILPCDYKFQWIQIIDGKKYKRQMWGCTRTLNSYNSGIYIDRYFTSLDNVDKFIIPLNDITEIFGYNDHLGNAQRLIISAKTKNPLTWQVSKIENTKPIGIIKVSVKQVPFNDDTDYIEYDENSQIIGMYADYYSVDQSTPIDESIVPPEPPLYDVTTVLSTSSPTIKVNGSYRTVTARFHDSHGDDVTSMIAPYEHTWDVFVCNSDGDRVVGANADITIKPVDGDANSLKVKITNSKDYIGYCIGIILSTNYPTYGELETPMSIIG